MRCHLWQPCDLQWFGRRELANSGYRFNMATEDDREAKLTVIAPGLAEDAPRRDEILAAHGVAINRGEDGYIDPVTGYFVMTAAYHLGRGTCCENDCRHCPYRDADSGVYGETSDGNS